MNVKKNIRNATFRLKVIILLLMIFWVKIFFSCIPSEDPIKIDYNLATLLSINNSGRFMEMTDSETMYYEAVAFRLTLSDTSYYLASDFKNEKGVFAFPTALAFSRVNSYIPVNKVSQIKVITLLGINDIVLKGDDISDRFLYAPDSDFELYKDSGYAISKLNGIQHEPGSSVDMILQIPVENEEAQFEIEVFFDNGIVLSCVTDTFTIVTP